MESSAIQPASETVTSAKPLLSVALITLNEEANLARTLGSIRWADEILVVDAGSSDQTVAVAESFGATVVHHPWQGFAGQKNFAIAQCRGEWVLSLDADEELTPALQGEIQALLRTGAAADAYTVRRRNLFLGRWMRHGGFYPDAKVRLFRRSAGVAFEARPVHESVHFSGTAGQLRHDLIHHAYPTLTGYLEHMNRYSSLGSELLVTKGKVSRGMPAFVVNVVLAPVGNFVWNYVFRLGWMDGREGLLLHLYQAVYSSWKYAKAWERGRRK